MKQSAAMNLGLSQMTSKSFAPKWVWITPALMLLLTFTILITDSAVNDRATSDEELYHLPTIEQFARQLPRPGLHDYRSATGPGYHLLMAVAYDAGLRHVTALRELSASIGIAWLAWLGWCTRSATRPWLMAAICFPLATSLYVVGATTWLAPDDLAWVTVFIALLLAFRLNEDRRTWIGVAAVLAAAVFVRQSNIWPAAVMVMAAIVTPATQADAHLNIRLHLRHDWILRALIAGAASIPAVGILVWFHHLWGGLVPPAFQTVAIDRAHVPAWHSGWQHEGPNFAVPAMVLAVFGVCAAFFASFFAADWRSLRRGRRCVLVGALVGFVAGIIPPTTWNEAVGRYSGLWNIAHHLPAIAQRSVFMVPLATFGGAMIAAWFIVLDARDRWIWLATWIAFIAAQTANAMAWQKYYEPFCLMMLPLAVSRLPSHGAAPKWAWLGPIALSAGLLAVTILNMHR